MIKHRHAFDGLGDEVSRDTGLACLDKSLAIQSQAEEADINTIVKRFGITGTVPQGARAPVYSDFDEVFDFQSAMDAVNEAQRSFMAMPWDVRKRFGNDPQEFVAFCSDESNIPEMRKMGLAIPEVVVVKSATLDDVVNTLKENRETRKD